MVTTHDTIRGNSPASVLNGLLHRQVQELDNARPVHSGSPRHTIPPRVIQQSSLIAQVFDFGAEKCLSVSDEFPVATLIVQPSRGELPTPSAKIGTGMEEIHILAHNRHRMRSSRTIAGALLSSAASTTSSSSIASCSYRCPLSQTGTAYRRAAGIHTSSYAQAKAAKGQAKPPPKSEKASQASTGVKLVEPSDPNVSACPPGTVLSGLGIYKDKAEPVALPDDAYPSWLWSLIETSSGQSSGGLSIAGAANMSKGELRVAQKKAMKELRAKAEAAKRAAQRAADSAAAAGADQSGTQRAAAAAASESLGEDISSSIASAPQTVDPALALVQAQQAAARDESKRKGELRKANKAKIKAKNFLSTS
ncbi:hypothetical protein OC846_002410 [Tilletia horrida]|uniref:Large ribosomal subunit protein mL54 n=1 Tax=Tilletia horrida TaxID=155126 RepID=A0AAN6JSN1_9BASI|nr:hypothetical protein OC846_002410 [Tilletia horrida]KAK0566348.1 hypothetical protein OC861_003279 [Tilletia horrida]